MTDEQSHSARVPYALPQPWGIQSEVVFGGALDIDAPDALWIPQAEGVDFRPLLFSASQGLFVNLLRVRKAGVLSRHRHSGAVHAFVLRGRWHYLEHDWVANQGDYVCEPPGEIHTLIVPDDVEEMVTLFHVTGGYTYVDPQGQPQGVEDVFTKIEAMRTHLAAIGRDPDEVRRIMR